MKKFAKTKSCAPRRYHYLIDEDKLERLLWVSMAWPSKVQEAISDTRVRMDAGTPIVGDHEQFSSLQDNELLLRRIYFPSKGSI